MEVMADGLLLLASYGAVTLRLDKKYVNTIAYLYYISNVLDQSGYFACLVFPWEV
jgi:hypothetical protein